MSHAVALSGCSAADLGATSIPCLYVLVERVECQGLVQGALIRAATRQTRLRFYALVWSLLLVVQA